ncbi:phage major capsid protein [Rhodopseudomonas palustris]|nr:phage major capsid protein [Rhodopseudomonas palustris]
MKRFTPWAAFAVMIAIAVVTVLALDYSAAAHAHGFGSIIADAAAGATAADELLREFKAHHTEVKQALEKAGVKDSELDARMVEVEQKLAQLRTGGGGQLPGLGGESWGSQVAREAKANGLSSRMDSPRVRFEVKAAALTSATADADGSAGDLVAPDIRTDVRTLARRNLRIRALFPQGRTASNAIWWPKQTGFTNSAGTVAEGDLKPQSEMKFDNETWTVKTIAHWLLASKQVLDDVPVLQSLIDSDLRYGLDYVEDNQLLNGGGTGSDLLGVYINALAFSAPFVATGQATEIDVLLQAIAQVDNLDDRFAADGIVINPLDWRRMQSLKDSTDRYLGNGPFGELVQRLWQLPIIPSKAMAVRKFLVGSFQAGGHIFDREDASVEASREDSDNWRRNLVTILGEKRLAFVIKRNLFVKGDFDDALTA